MKANFLPFPSAQESNSHLPNFSASVAILALDGHINLGVRLHIGTILRKYEAIPRQTTMEGLKMEKYFFLTRTTHKIDFIFKRKFTFQWAFSRASHLRLLARRSGIVALETWDSPSPHTRDIYCGFHNYWPEFLCKIFICCLSGFCEN